MRVVRTPGGERGVVLEADDAECLVRRVADGTERRVPRARLTEVPGADVLSALGASASPEAPPLPVDDDRVAGLLIAIGAADPLPVRRMMTLTDACESTVVPWTSTLRSAGFVERVDEGATPGYRLTPRGRTIAASLRQG